MRRIKLNGLALTGDCLDLDCQWKRREDSTKTSSRNMANTNISRTIAIKRMMERNRKRRIKLFNLFNVILARRRRIVLTAIMILQLCLNVNRNVTIPRPIRSCRRLVRNSGWWETVWTQYSDARFKKTFRVSKNTFAYLLTNIRHLLERQTLCEVPISPEQRLALCLYRLGRGDYFYTISEMTGLGASTVCAIVSEVSSALIECLWEREITAYMPKNEAEFLEKIHDMEQLWQFPGCWAAVDGCHISIKCPPGGLESCKEYHNFKNFYSIILMSMVDAKYRFIWGSCGFPGNSHDSIIFQSTEIWNKIQEKDYLPLIAKNVGDCELPPVLLADSAFPLKPWLLKPYSNAVLTPKQRNFNYRLSRARMVVESAYGMLKGRWRVLLRKCECSTDQVKMVTLACMVLHNVCISQDDSMPQTLDITVDQKTKCKRSSTEVRELLNMTTCRKVKDSDRSAIRLRDKLADRFWQEKEALINK